MSDTNSPTFDGGKRQPIPVIPDPAALAEYACRHPKTIELADGARVCTTCTTVLEPIERFVFACIAADGCLEMVAAVVS